MIGRWVEKYLGIPFNENGFDEKGCHCWGLVRLVFNKELNIILPDYGEIEASSLIKITRTINKQSLDNDWNLVNDPATFNVLVMAGRIVNEGRVPLHIGILVDAGSVLHVERSTDSVVVPLDHPSIKFRKLAMYRHRLLYE